MHSSLGNKSETPSKEKKKKKKKRKRKRKKEEERKRKKKTTMGLMCSLTSLGQWKWLPGMRG